MSVFLQILGGLCLFGILVAVGIWIYIRWKFNQIKKLAEQIGGSLVPPSRVTLNGTGTPNWSDRSWAQGWIEEFRANGFEEVGAFDVEEIPNLIVYGFCDQSRSVWGTVTEMGSVARYAEIVAHFEDGRSFMATTQDPAMASQLPWQTAVHLPSARLAELIRAFESRGLEGELKGVHPSIFVDRFTEAYQRGMEYQFSEGPLRNSFNPDILEISDFAGVDYPDFGACLAALGEEQAHHTMITKCDEFFEEDSRYPWDLVDEGGVIYVYGRERLAQVTNDFVEVVGGDVRDHYDLEKEFAGDAFEWVRDLAIRVSADARFEMVAEFEVMREKAQAWVFVPGSEV